MKKEYTSIKKFNGGAGAILCAECWVVLKEGFLGNSWAEIVHKKMGTYPGGLITQEEWESNEPMFCDKCKDKTKSENKNLKSTEKQ